MDGTPNRAAGTVADNTELLNLIRANLRRELSFAVDVAGGMRVRERRGDERALNWRSPSSPWVSAEKPSSLIAYSRWEREKSWRVPFSLRFHDLCSHGMRQRHQRCAPLPAEKSGWCARFGRAEQRLSPRQAPPLRCPAPPCRPRLG